MARESTIGSVFKMEVPPTSGTPDSITAATKGTTTEITTTGTYAVGDFAVIEGTGWKSLDRATAHRVSSLGTGKITIDTDTSDETGAVSAGTVRKLTLVETCFAEFTPESSKPGEVDVTTMCDTERRNVAGLSSPGSASFGGPLDLTDAGQKELIAAHKDGVTRNLLWITRGGQTGVMSGTVSSFAAGPSGVEQAVSFSGTFQIGESPVYLEPLAP